MDYFKDTDTFQMFNPNPTESQSGKSKKCDCYVRAFAIAGDITWLEAFDLLVAKARETYNVPGDSANLKAVFEDFGFVAKQLKVAKGKKRMRVADFCKKHRKGRFILKVANHLTAVVDGVCYDSWNTANCCIYKYWELEKQ